MQFQKKVENHCFFERRNKFVSAGTSYICISTGGIAGGAAPGMLYNYCFRNKCMSFGSVFALVPGIKEP